MLGPRLFSMYMKPLGNIIKRHQLDMHFYADDVQIYTSFKAGELQSRTDAISRVNRCLEDVRQWMADNMLKLNESKTEMVLFSSKHRPSLADDFTVSVGGVNLCPAASCRSLGVILDKHMTMSQHVNAVCRSAYYHLRSIGQIRKCLTTDATKSLVHGLVTSRIDYCNALINGIPVTLMSKLQRVQNVSARIITRKRCSEHITPLLMDLHWLPVSRHVEFKIITLVFKALHGEAPRYILDLIDIYAPTRSLRSQFTTSLRAPRTKTVFYGDRQFGKVAATLWNSLPKRLRELDKLGTFRKALKTHLFTKEYGT